jgi:hypothetical protein
MLYPSLHAVPARKSVKRFSRGSEDKGFAGSVEFDWQDERKISQRAKVRIHGYDQR